jgi:hypothetical protein
MAIELTGALGDEAAADFVAERPACLIHEGCWGGWRM